MPRTNEKAQRFIHSLCKEWAYAMAFQNSQELEHWLPCSLSIYIGLGPDLFEANGFRCPRKAL
jgi:hypothetical protein